MSFIKTFSAIVVLCAAGVTAVQAGDDIKGEWQGAIKIMGQELGIKARFQQQGEALSATLDIPQQNAKDLPLQNVSHAHPKVHFEIPGAAVATFEGTVDGDRISGDYLQSGMKGTFELQRISAEAVAAVAPAEVLPYKQEEVTFHNGDITLAGTLTVPEGMGPYPAVVMISGSGAQNRDEDILGFKLFRIIADHLTRAGIAVLRYDDRGVGGSSGSVKDSTSTDFAGDVVSAVTFLKQRKDIDGAHIGAIGHSEGGIVAPIAAQSGELAFVVLLAGTAMTGEEILYDQGRQIMIANGATEEQLQTQKQTQQKIFAALRSDEGWDEVEAMFAAQTRAGLDALPEDQRATLGDLDQFVKTQVDAQINGVRNAWFRSFIDYDPVPALEALKVPALAIFGELDLQVPPKANSEGMEKAFRKSGLEKHKVVTLPKANHLFQKATTGSPNEYGVLEKAFVPELMPLVTDWIKSVTRG